MLNRYLYIICVVRVVLIFHCLQRVNCRLSDPLTTTSSAIGMRLNNIIGLHATQGDKTEFQFLRNFINISEYFNIIYNFKTSCISLSAGVLLSYFTQENILC